MADFTFKTAVPVWERGTETAMNRTVDFCATLPKTENAVLCVAGATVYTVFVNGKAIAFGPARTAHGYYKVDQLPLPLTAPENTLCIRVTGYNLNSFAYVDAPSFLCAEVRVGERVLAATGGDFSAFVNTSRVTATERYCYQRALCEVYDTDGISVPTTLSPTAPKRFLKRDVPYEEYAPLHPVGGFRRGTVVKDDGFTAFHHREIPGVGDWYKQFPADKLDYSVVTAYDPLTFTVTEEGDFSLPVTLAPNTFADLRFARNGTGHLSITFTAEGAGEIFLTFDELLTNGELRAHRGNLINVIAVKTGGGTHTVLTAEPYVLQYLRVTARGTAVTVTDITLTERAYPMSRIVNRLSLSDEKLSRIYDAAVASFRDNTVDIFMDCPSRERAGWLCDSYFTGRTERALTGKSTVEAAFLRNFLRFESAEGLPSGMLPMCYPADVMKGEFIPNWALWYILHLHDYCTAAGDTALAAEAKETVYALLSYFRSFENQDGLLENLQGWIFVEWSKANDLVQDVNYPSNMVYAAVKSRVGELYGDTALAAQGEAIRCKVREQSRTAKGTYCDNALRKNGVLTLSGECTEACQYYAFYFGIATPETDNDLWQRLLHDCGNGRTAEGLHPANAFIGNYLRMELLLRYGYTNELVQNIKDYFYQMAVTTGTLWEHMSPEASCNHGFASYIAYLLHKLLATKASLPEGGGTAKPCRREFEISFP